MAQKCIRSRKNGSLLVYYLHTSNKIFQHKLFPFRALTLRSSLEY